MAREVFAKMLCFEAVDLVSGFEKLFGQGFLALFPEVGGADSVACLIRYGLDEDLLFLFRNR